MASTNKTTHYELSQFLGTDKPAWLTDYNADMSKIDTGINSAQTTATAADGKADSANTAIGTLGSLNTTVKTDLVSAINEVDTNADTAQETANTAVTKAAANEQAIGTIATILNLNTTLTYNNVAITSSNGTVGTGELYVSRNSDGSLFKLYGNILTTSATSGDVVLSLPTTGVSATTEYSIVGCGYSFSTTGYIVRPLTITVKTNGTIELKMTVGGGGETNVLRPLACLYFNSDFGNIQPSA